MSTVRINVRSIANARGARKEQRNGRDVYVVPSVTLPDDVIMNGVKYPAAEIEKSFKMLHRTPAPLGHPRIGNAYISARDPEGLNMGYVGAWNENPKRKKGRVYLDKIIDIDVANRTEDGKRLIAAIEAGGPIHTSTGLVAKLTKVNGGDHTSIASDLIFDHDAILLDEDGAATPEQGVGMLVNGESVEVINCSVPEELDRELDWALDSIARNLERRERVSMLQTLREALLGAFSASQNMNVEKENADMGEKELADLQNRLNDLDKKVTDALGDNLTTAIANAVTAALTPVTEQVQALTNAQKEAEQAEHTALVNKVHTAGILSEDAAKTLTNTALAELVAKIKPGKAAPINGAFVANSGKEDEFKDYSLNSMLEDK